MAATTTLSRSLQRNLIRPIFSWPASMRLSPPPPGSAPSLATMETATGVPPPPEPDPNKGDAHVMPVSSENLELRAKHGVSIISSGGLIATPTDTVYGIAGDAQNDLAISRIYQIKGRIASKPVAICVSKIDEVYLWGKVNVPRSLLEELLPGPVTLVFERQSVLNPNLNPNTNFIGIRIPDHKFIMSLADLHGGPVALTSANYSSEPSTLAVKEFKEMWPSLHCVFDGGRLSSCEKSEAAARAGSTVIDLSEEGYFSIIRNGTAYEQCISLLKCKYGMKERSLLS